MVYRELKIKYSADVAGAINGLREVNSKVDATNKDIESKYKSLTDKLKSMSIAGSIAITAPLLVIGKKMLDTAMNAVESENLFSVSMGKMANSANAWSNQVSQALGLNSIEVRKNLGTWNVMLGSMGMTEKQALSMSEGMTKLAYDMASFYNLDNASAFEKLRSGITGEIEPLRQLGIIVSEAATKNYAYNNGIAETGKQLTDTQKVMARYGLIMELTSKAQGDLARTADSPANMLRRLQNQATELASKLGTSLLPVFKQVVKILTDLTDRFNKLSPEQQESYLKWLAIAAVIPPVMGVMANLIPVITAVKNGLLALKAANLACSTSFNIAGASAGALVTGLLLVIPAAIAAGNALVDWDNKKRAIQDKTDSYNNNRAKISDNIDKGIFPKSYKEALRQQDLLAKGSKDDVDVSYHSLIPLNNYIDAHKKQMQEYDKQLATSKMPKIDIPKIASASAGHAKAIKEAIVKPVKVLAETLKEVLPEVTSEQAQVTDILAKIKAVEKKKNQAIEDYIKTSWTDDSIDGGKANGKFFLLSGKGQSLATANLDARLGDLKNKLYSNSQFIAELDAGNESKALNAENKGTDTGWYDAGVMRLKSAFDKNKQILDNLKYLKVDVTNRLKELTAKYQKDLGDLGKQLLEQSNDEIKAEQDKTDAINKDIADRILAYRKESDEYNKQIQQQIQADNDRKKSLIGFTSLKEVYRKTMLSGARNQYSNVDFGFTASASDRPISQAEYTEAERIKADEARKQTILLESIATFTKNLQPGY